MSGEEGTKSSLGANIVPEDMSREQPVDGLGGKEAENCTLHLEHEPLLDIVLLR